MFSDASYVTNNGDVGYQEMSGTTCFSEGMIVSVTFVSKKYDDVSRDHLVNLLFDFGFEHVVVSTKNIADFQGGDTLSLTSRKFFIN